MTVKIFIFILIAIQAIIFFTGCEVVEVGYSDSGYYAPRAYAAPGYTTRRYGYGYRRPYYRRGYDNNPYWNEDREYVAPRRQYYHRRYHYDDD
jgi:hypothetical protein